MQISKEGGGGRGAGAAYRRAAYSRIVQYSTVPLYSNVRKCDTRCVMKRGACSEQSHVYIEEAHDSVP